MLDNEDINIDKDKLTSEEFIELEFDQDSVAYYIVDENDVEIGVCLYEDGKQVEYYYAQPAYEKSNKSVSDTSNLEKGLSEFKNEVDKYKPDVIDVAKNLKSTANELNQAYNDIFNKFKIS